MLLPLLTLYSRPACHLCHDVQALLDRFEFRYQVIDIESDPEIHDLYAFDIPVIALGDEVLLRGRIERGQLAHLKLRLLDRQV